MSAVSGGNSTEYTIFYLNIYIYIYILEILAENLYFNMSWSFNKLL